MRRLRAPAPSPAVLLCRGAVVGRLRVPAVAGSLKAARSLVLNEQTRLYNDLARTPADPFHSTAAHFEAEDPAGLDQERPGGSTTSAETAIGHVRDIIVDYTERVGWPLDNSMWNARYEAASAAVAKTARGRTYVSVPPLNTASFPTVLRKKAADTTWMHLEVFFADTSEANGGDRSTQIARLANTFNVAELRVLAHLFLTIPHYPKRSHVIDLVLDTLAASYNFPRGEMSLYDALIRAMSVARVGDITTIEQIINSIEECDMDSDRSVAHASFQSSTATSIASPSMSSATLPSSTTSQTNSPSLPLQPTQLTTTLHSQSSIPPSRFVKVKSRVPSMLWHSAVRAHCTRYGAVATLRWLENDVFGQKRASWTYIMYNMVLKRLLLEGEFDVLDDLIARTNDLPFNAPVFAVEDVLVDDEASNGANGANATADKGSSRVSKQLVYACNATEIQKIRTYVALGKLQEAVDLFDLFRERKFRMMQASSTFGNKNICVLDRWTYEYLINKCVANYAFRERAMSMLDDMQADGMAPIESTYASLMNAYRAVGLQEVAIDIFQDMVAAGVPPSTLSCNELIRSLADMKRINEAVDVFRDAMEDGIGPDVYMYASLMHAYADMGNIAELLALKKDMVEVERIPLTPYVYSILVHAYARNNEVDRAIDFLEEMMQQGLNPTLVHYNAILNGHAHLRNMSKALQVFEMLLNHGPHPDLWSYHHLLSGFLRAHDINNALLILRTMKEQRDPRELCRMLRETLASTSDIVTKPAVNAGTENADDSPVAEPEEIQDVSAVADASGKDPAELVDDASSAQEAESADEQQEAVRAPKPTIVTYNSFINYFAKKADVENCQKYFQYLVDDGLTPNLHTIMPLMEAFASVGDTATAEEFRALADRVGLSQSIGPYNVLIEYHLRNRNIDYAMNELMRAKRAEIRPDVRTFDMLIRAFTHEGRHAEVAKLEELMRENEVAADNRFYQTITNGYINRGELDLALDAVAEMLSRPSANANLVFVLLQRVQDALDSKGSPEQMERFREIARMAVVANEPSLQDKDPDSIDDAAVAATIAARAASRRYRRGPRVPGRWRWLPPDEPPTMWHAHALQHQPWMQQQNLPPHEQFANAHDEDESQSAQSTLAV